jgi:hypothetical protein
MSWRIFNDRERWRTASRLLGLIACAAPAFGVIAGITLAARRQLVVCSTPRVVPVGGDSNCYSHPQLLLGVAVAVVSVGLLALAALVVIIAGVLGPLRRSTDA